MTDQDQQPSPVAQSDLLQVRLSPELRDGIGTAARARGMTTSEWVRQATRTCAALEGVTIAPRDAGTLYDRVDGRDRWARIEGDQIKGIGYHDAKPDDGNVYVPVVHEDSEPFDIAKHWRMAPYYTLVDVYGTPDRVICTYPVVPKSLEWA